MTSLLTTTLSLFALTSALPTTTTTPTYKVNSTLSFTQSTFEQTNSYVFGAGIKPLIGEGACYPHIYSSTYLSDNFSTALNLTVTGATNSKTGNTPVNAIAIEDGCWGLSIETGVLVARAGAAMKGWYVDSKGKLGHESVKHGFYYCYDTEGKGVVGIEDKGLTHNGHIYGVCFDFDLTVANPQ